MQESIPSFYTNFSLLKILTFIIAFLEYPLGVHFCPNSAKFCQMEYDFEYEYNCLNHTIQQVIAYHLSELGRFRQIEYSENTIPNDQ